MNRRGSRGLLLSAVVIFLTAATPVQAYVQHYLESSIIGRLGSKQSETFVRTFKTALAETPDNDSVTLSIPAEGRVKPVDGTLTLLQTKIDKGDKCRKIRTELRQAQKKEHWMGWYCQQPNGDWKGRAVAE